MHELTGSLIVTNHMELVIYVTHQSTSALIATNLIPLIIKHPQNNLDVFAIQQLGLFFPPRALTMTKFIALTSEKC